MSPPLDEALCAEALLVLAEATGSVSRVQEDLAACVDWLSRQGDVSRFVQDESIHIDGRQQALETLLRDSIGPEVRHWVHFLADARLLSHLPSIAEHYFRRAADRSQRLDGELTSAALLSPSTVSQIEIEIGRLLKQPVRLRLRVDPNLIAGCRIQAGSFIFDGTLDGRLDALRRTLIA